MEKLLTQIQKENQQKSEQKQLKMGKLLIQTKKKIKNYLYKRKRNSWISTKTVGLSTKAAKSPSKINESKQTKSPTKINESKQTKSSTIINESKLSLPVKLMNPN